MNRTLALLAACVASPALATGDHDWTDSARYLCGTSTTLVFLTQHDHTGGGISHTNTWSWTVLDVATGKRTQHPLGVATTTPMDDLVHVPFKPEGAGAAKAFAALGQTGCSLEHRFTSRTPSAWGVERWSFAPNGAGLELSLRHLLLGERTFKRTLKAAWITEAVPGEEYDDAPTLVDEIAASPKLTVLHFAISKLTHSPISFAAVDPSALVAARGSLYNEVGLELHRAGHYALALEWFTAAPNAQSNYNSACAFARLGDAKRAAEYLGYSGEPKKVAAKVARDRDFDRVRKSPELTAFLQSASAADAGP